MPLLLLNLGGEMMYILHQRLHAQKVSPEKSKQVLVDVIKTMFSLDFLDELFKPQSNAYASTSMKQLFQKIAHASIMRLNSNSMEKLFDLMTMSLKSQIMRVKLPQQILIVTLNHLESVLAMTSDPNATSLVAMAITKSLELYTTISDGRWLRIKKEMLNFFQNKKIKVAQFLSTHMQTFDGDLILGQPKLLPHGTEYPGKIMWIESDQVIKVTSFHYEYMEITENDSTFSMDAADSGGRDIYGGNSSEGAFPSCITAAELYGSHLGKRERRDELLNSQAKDEINQLSTASSAKAEMSLLSDLLGGVGSSSSNSNKGERNGDEFFSLNLFPDPIGSVDSDGNRVDDDIIHFEIDAKTGAKDVASYMESLNLLDDNDGRAQAKATSSNFNSADTKSKSNAKATSGASSKDDNLFDDEDDLLAMMDDAAK